MEGVALGSEEWEGQGPSLVYNALISCIVGEANIENSVHVLTKVFLVEKKQQNFCIFHFSLYVKYNSFYYASPKTLAFINLFGAIEGDVYRILKCVKFDICS